MLKGFLNNDRIEQTLGPTVSCISAETTPKRYSSDCTVSCISAETTPKFYSSDCTVPCISAETTPKLYSSDCTVSCISAETTPKLYSSDCTVPCISAETTPKFYSSDCTVPWNTRRWLSPNFSLHNVFNVIKMNQSMFRKHLLGRIILWTTPFVR